MVTLKGLLGFAAAGALLLGIGRALDGAAPGGAASASADARARAARPSQAEGGPRNWSNTPPWAEQPGGPRHLTFHSDLVKQDVGYSIWLPPQYEQTPDARFPVIYHLHGIGGTEVAGPPRFARFLLAAIEAGKCPPTIFVMVNGYRDSFYVDSFDKAVPMESIIIKELIPHVDKTYRTVADRSGRAIEGFSMGGYGAMRLGLKYPELFSSIVAMGGAFIGEDTARSRGQAAFGGDMEFFRQVDPATVARTNAEKIRAGKMHILVVCGDRDGLLGSNRRFDALLTELKIDHAFEVVPGVGHDLVNMYGGMGDLTWESHAKAFRSAGGPASQPASRPATEGAQAHTAPSR